MEKYSNLNPAKGRMAVMILELSVAVKKYFKPK
jgi:hypothetical protein